MGVALVASSTIATAQRQRSAQPDITLSQSVRPLRMQHRGRMGSGMMQMQMASEFDYLSQMIPHHQEAIDTAEIVLERSDRPEMKAFAQEIIEVQSAEIEQMRAWLDEWYPEQQSALSHTLMMRDLSQLQGDELDQAFLEDMIIHHHMAVMMSRMLIHHGLVEHEAVYPFAEQIATSQMNEIYQMQSWLHEWFGATGMMYRRGNMRSR
ncbi:MAG: DUF305 domain-containing protein [Leptolyngbyaceae cyanobacterium RM1_406_9]|nr:DUF305 domain-containing protein [Leptolyngbyaceae cyanobacterium RM1_406_9]